MSADGRRDTDALRRMVREVLREVFPREGTVDSEPGGEPDVRRVRVRDDRDLAGVVTQVLDLAEDPSRAAALRAGRIRFALVSDEAPGTAPATDAIEVERGAVTERLVQRAAREQRALRLGPRAVLTPLARDRARALGVTMTRTEGQPSERRETR